MSLDVEKVGEIAGQIQKLAPLAIKGVLGAKDLIKGLIDDIHAWKTEGDSVTAEAEQASRAEGHAQTQRLVDRAAEAKAFLESQGQ